MAVIEYLKKTRESSIYQALSSQFQNSPGRLTLALSKETSGYSGKELVHISEDPSFFDAPDFKGKDTTRFPARIKAMATLLRNQECFGYFEIQHDKGVITVAPKGADDSTLASASVKLKALELWHSYTREEVHSIFAPETKFTPRAGTWGLQGIVAVPGQDGDYVFFVTYGQSQAEHEFDESVSVSGVLSWQSQPQQAFSSPVIKRLIAHDSQRNSIHLFLRVAKGEKYAYFGKLSYITHDAERQKPVYFQWQINEWPPTESFLSEVGLKLVPDEFPNADGGESIATELGAPERQLIEADPPAPKATRFGVPTKEFQAKKLSFSAEKDAANKKLGLLGEEKVVEFEQQALTKAGKLELAAQVRHVSKLDGDGAGYDILSFTPAGEKKYIEVKTTRGNQYVGFFISSNEVSFSRAHAENYYLYRIYGWGETETKFYILRGAMEEKVDLEPVSYRARPKGTG